MSSCVKNKKFYKIYVNAVF